MITEEDKQAILEKIFGKPYCDCEECEQVRYEQRSNRETIETGQKE